MKTTHGKFIILLFIVPIIFFVVHLAFLHPCYSRVLSCEHFWSFYCFIFLLCWWIIYFSGEKLKIWSLRLFLDKYSLFRKKNQQQEPQGQQVQNQHTLEQKIVNKSYSTITMLSILMVVVALFLTLVLNFKYPDQYQNLLRIIILITALTTIILMIFAIDILDTVANYFREGVKKPYDYQVYFYRKVGIVPRGGISYAYYSYASFTLFLILSLSFFAPLLAGLGLSLFIYLGYPILFGYKRECDNNQVRDVEIDEEIRWPSIWLGAFFLIVTGLIWWFG